MAQLKYAEFSFFLSFTSSFFLALEILGPYNIQLYINKVVLNCTFWLEEPPTKSVTIYGFNEDEMMYWNMKQEGN